MKIKNSWKNFQKSCNHWKKCFLFYAVLFYRMYAYRKSVLTFSVSPSFYISIDIEFLMLTKFYYSFIVKEKRFLAKNIWFFILDLNLSTENNVNENTYWNIIYWSFHYIKVYFKHVSTVNLCATRYVRLITFLILMHSEFPVRRK